MYVLFHESTSQIRLHHEKSRLTSPEFLEFNFNTAYGNGESRPIYAANEVEQMGAYIVMGRVISNSIFWVLENPLNASWTRFFVIFPKCLSIIWLVFNVEDWKIMKKLGEAMTKKHVLFVLNPLNLIPEIPIFGYPSHHY